MYYTIPKAQLDRAHIEAKEKFNLIITTIKKIKAGEFKDKEEFENWMVMNCIPETERNDLSWITLKLLT